MAEDRKVLVSESALQGMANAIREMNGEDLTYKPSEMGAAAKDALEATTFILVTPNGEEIPATWVESGTSFDATENDIRIGKKACTSKGVITGTKVIPSYHTTEGIKVIPAGSAFKVNNPDSMVDSYDYTKLQAIFCAFNTSLSDSVGATRVSINGVVYDVNSVEAVSVVSKDHEGKIIDFGIINDTSSPCVIRYLMYKEIQ